MLSDTVTLNAAGSALDDLGVAMANASDLYDKSAASTNSVGTPAPSDLHDSPHVERPHNTSDLEMQQSTDKTRFLVSNS